MVLRVDIHGGLDAAMSVSMDGIDVSTASLEQMGFDSRYSGHQLYYTGFIDSHNDINVAYTFPVALTYVPLMTAYVDTNLAAPNTNVLGLHNYRGNSSDFWYYAVVTASYVSFRYNFGNQTGRLWFALFKRVAG